MKFGVREICDVVLKTKAIQQVGNKIFYKNEPVLYFDSLKTSSMEGAATTVYAQGGKGNSRLVAWEGERTVTFTMEDALLSPAGFSILSGAGLVNASDEKKIKTHITERTADIEYIKAGEEYAAIDFSFDAIEDYNETPTQYSTRLINAGTNVEIDNNNVVYYILENNQYKVAVPHRFRDEETLQYYWAEDEHNPQTYYIHNLDGTPEIAESDLIFIYITQKPYLFNSSSIYIMRMVNDEVITEPFIPINVEEVVVKEHPHYGEFRLTLNNEDDLNKGFLVPDDPVSFTDVLIDDKHTAMGWPAADYEANPDKYQPDPNITYYRKIAATNTYEKAVPVCAQAEGTNYYYWFVSPLSAPNPPVAQHIHFYTGDPNYKLDDDAVALIDYYTERSVGYEINITPDKFGGNYYLEASTLFRDTDGVDLPALFIIPNCKIQSNFTFTMASSGDPSTFTFTMDAFPDFTRFDKKRKVLTSIQILDVTSEDSLDDRTVVPWRLDDGSTDAIRDKTWSESQPKNN